MGAKIALISPIPPADQESVQPAFNIQKKQLQHPVPPLHYQNLPQTIARQQLPISLTIRRALPLPMRYVPVQERIK